MPVEVSYTSIPAELRERPQWVVWRYEIHGDRETKVPYQSAYPTVKASSTDPATWGTFEQAVEGAKQTDGIGYVFSADDPYTGIDFDEITPEVEQAIRTLDSYTEKSVSGRGAHVIVKGHLTGTRRRRGKFEVYSDGRYFCMTGVPLNGHLKRIAARQAELDEVVGRFLPAEQPATPRQAPQPNDQTDHELIEKMLSAKNGHNVSPLWDGDTSGYSSHSEADLALCNCLAFWTRGDPVRMDSLFRQSGLYREKWERPDYREATITRAIATTNEVYEPGSRQKQPVTADEAGNTESTDDALSSLFVDWGSFWARDREAVDWVYEEVLARGRGHVIYAGHKEGKSLLALFLAVEIAATRTDCVVVYLDYEMGEDDLCERLEDMGYGPKSDLSRLRYALLPTLPPLDTASGALALTRLLDAVQATHPGRQLVVVIDTIGRAVTGEENSADTFRAFYHHAGIELRRRGATWVRLDHGGKDPTRGQRGSSGKGDDVDVVWRLARTQDGVTLHRDVARMAWVPERVSFRMEQEPLRFVRVSHDWPAGTKDTADMLDRLGVALDSNARVAQQTLKAAGEGRRKQAVVAALRWRRQSAGGPQ